ncbi:MAG: RpiB/LacA/LacB family sugar-phosphate isomerase [Spirochaetales bacterium]|nr:RpiB/LacA/LacB family sugar-phosphate isomerase [Spirochaetales bacterium]
MNIIMANDHAAVELKTEIKNYLEAAGHHVTDLGVGNGERADYPDKGAEAAREYLKGGYDFGILCCGTGIGISIAANKVKGIRCALPQNLFAAQMAKEHNNCQFIAFGGRIEYPQPVTQMVQGFIDASFGGERHARRVEMIMEIES